MRCVCARAIFNEFFFCHKSVINEDVYFRRALTARVMQAAKGGYKGTVIMVPLKVHEAANARDALAKAIYSRLFDYIVGRINASIPFQVNNIYIKNMS